jgi:hypothetical protein
VAIRGKLVTHGLDTSFPAGMPLDLLTLVGNQVLLNNKSKKKKTFLSTNASKIFNIAVLP